MVSFRTAPRLFVTPASLACVLVMAIAVPSSSLSSTRLSASAKEGMAAAPTDTSQSDQGAASGERLAEKQLDGNPVDSIQLCPAAVTLYVGEAKTLIPQALDVDGKIVAGVDATFSSDNAAVVDVTSWGELEAISSGTATITVTMETVSVQVSVGVQTGFRTPIDDATSDQRAATECSGGGGNLQAFEDDPEPFVHDVTLEENEVGAPKNAAVEAATGSAAKAHGNYGSASFSFVAPVVSIGGRESTLNLALVYNSQVWEKESTAGAGMNYNFGRSWPALGWRLGFGRIVTNYDGTGLGDMSGNGIGNAPGNALLIEPDGTRTKLSQSFDGATWSHQSEDGRLLRYNPINRKLKYPDGTLIAYDLVNNRTQPVSIQTPNGNVITIQYRAKTSSFGARTALDFIRDTALRQVNFQYDEVTDPANPRLISVTAPAFGGGSRTLVQIDYQNLTLNYPFSIPVTDPPNSNPIKVIRRIYYPLTGTGFVFADYSSYGMIRKVSQRINMSAVSDGAEIAFSSYNYPDGSTSLSGPPRYSQRSEWWQGMQYDDTGVSRPSSDPVLYGYGSSTSGTVQTYTVTHPINARTGETLFEITKVDNGAMAAGSGKLSVTELRKNSPSGTLMFSTQTDYSTSGNGAQRSQVTVTNEAGQISKEVMTYDSGSPSYGRLMTMEEYDNTTKLRKTTYTYADATPTGESYVTTNNNTGNFLQLVTSVSVFDPTLLVAKTELEYDRYSTDPSDGSTRYPMLTYSSVAPLLTRNSRFDTVTSGQPMTVQRGNVTQLTHYSSVAGAGTKIKRKSQYDVNGNLVLAELGCCNQRTYTYSSSGLSNSPGAGIFFSVPVAETEGPTGGPNLTTSYVYDAGNTNNPATGVIKQVITPQLHTVTYGYDSALRPISTSEPTKDGTNASTTLLTTMAYDIDPSSGLSTGKDQLTYREQVTYADNGVQKTQVSMSWLDGAGHPIRSGVRSASDPVGFDATQVRFDVFGRPLMQSNEYASTSNDGSGTASGWTTNTYDVIGRVRTLTRQDGQTIQTTFGGRTTSVADEVGRKRTASVDALGRLVQVLEDTKVGGTNWRTDYVYDAIDDLKTVKMFFAGTPDPNNPSTYQSRSANYDALGRLTSRTTPEGGNESYAYLANNELDLVDTYTDGRGAQTKYHYDGLNRVYWIEYLPNGSGATDPPDVTIAYSTTAGPTNGRITNITSAPASTETYSYDSLGLGRVETRTVQIDSRTYNVQYGYNGAGQQATMTYPSGRQVRTSFDSRGRLSSLAKTNSAALTYLSGATYNAAQQIRGIRSATAWSRPSDTRFPDANN